MFFKAHYSRRKESIFPDCLWKSSREELIGEPRDTCTAEVGFRADKWSKCNPSRTPCSSITMEWGV